MVLTFESNLDDIAEPPIRQFLRSRSAKAGKIRNTIIGAVAGSLTALFVLRDEGGIYVWVVPIVCAVLGAAVNFLIYESGVRSRVRKYVKRETEGKLPSATTYRIEGGKLACDSLGVTVTFSLSDLESIADDGERMEIVFGSRGLCMIPLRAFKSAGEQEAFVALLRGGEQ